MTKSPVQSKTLNGILLMAGVMLANKLGFTVDGTTLMSMMDEIVGVIGAVLATYGRFKATHALGKDVKKL